MGSSFKKALKSVAGYAKSDKKSLRQLLLSIVSLTMAVVVLVTMTFSWFSVKNSNLESELFTLDCGKGLRVNDSGTTELSYSTANKYITPASSVDGRNLFFPTDGTDFSKNTEQMTFRSSTVGDKNVNYIQIDFSLTAQQNHTALYINDDKTSIKVSNEGEWSVPHAAALRSALWSSTAEEGVPNTPIVFNPTTSTMRTAAIENVDRSTGAFISSGRQVAHAFSEYSFGGEPVATLSKGVETHFSYIIWLEGTDPKCTNKIMQKDIQINLAFTTSWDKTQTIRFRDDTTKSYQVTDEQQNVYNVGFITKKISEGYSLSLQYVDAEANNQATSTNMDFNMYKANNDPDNNVWTCNIPGDMRNKITFILRPPSNSQGQSTYIFRKNSKAPNNTPATITVDGQTVDNPAYYTYDRGANRMYCAESINNNDPSLCAGYWMAVGDSDGAGHDSGTLDGDDF